MANNLFEDGYDIIQFAEDAGIADEEEVQNEVIAPLNEVISRRVEVQNQLQSVLKRLHDKRRVVMQKAEHLACITAGSAGTSDRSDILSAALQDPVFSRKAEKTLTDASNLAAMVVYVEKLSHHCSSASDRFRRETHDCIVEASKLLNMI